MIMNFKYFLGPPEDMGDLERDILPCSLCRQADRCFRLEYALCPAQVGEQKKQGFGCFSCLRAGRFEFWHDTEIGTLDENGLMNVYKHNQPAPPNFPTNALADLRRTPQIVTWQQELWLVHCNDFMAYLGTWEPPDFYANAPDGDGRALFHQMTDDDYSHLWDESLPDGAERLDSWYATYYVFRCLSCGKLRGNWDCD